MHAPSSDWVFLLHCHQFRKPLMEKINPDTQTSPLCLFTWRVIIATRDLHPADIFSPSPNYGPPLPTATGTAVPGRPAGSLPQRHKPGSCWGEAAGSPDLSRRALPALSQDGNKHPNFSRQAQCTQRQGTAQFASARWSWRQLGGGAGCSPLDKSGPFI